MKLYLNPVVTLIFLTTLLLFPHSTFAKDLEFSLPYEQSWLPTPRTNLSKRSILVIESKAQFKRIFGIYSPVKINWKKSFLILGTAGGRTNGGYQLSIDRVSTRNRTIKRGSSSIREVLVSMTEIIPSSDCITPSVISYPKAIIQVRRDDESLSIKPLAAKLVFYTKIIDSCDS